MKITPKQLLTAVAVAIGGVALIRFIKHEAKEMKKEKEEEAETVTETASFTADEATYMNYVDEGFMGFTANDEFMMLGGGKPIEFANFKGHEVPIATDEPNFANSNGTQSDDIAASVLISPDSGKGGSKTTGAKGKSSGISGRGKLIRPIMPRPKKEPLDIEDIWKSGKKYRNPLIQQAPQEKVRVGKRGTITPKGVVLPPRRGKAIKAETDTMSSKGRK